MRKGEYYESGMQYDHCRCSVYETPDPRRTLKRMITSPKKTKRDDAWMWREQERV
jgi:hypothetical protein